MSKCKFSKAKKKWYDKCLKRYQIIAVYQRKGELSPLNYPLVECVQGWMNDKVSWKYKIPEPSRTWKHKVFPTPLKILMDAFYSLDDYTRFFYARSLMLKHKREQRKADFIKVEYKTVKSEELAEQKVLLDNFEIVNKFIEQ